MTALIETPVMPKAGERNVHGNASFEPHYFERALHAASQAGAGLAFMHSHPFGYGWQGMSRDDIRAEEGHAAAVYGATRLPFVGLTLAGSHAWSARFWERTGPRIYACNFCGTVRVVGDELAVTYFDRLAPSPAPTEALLRTMSAWGEETQADLARLRVGVIGAGSVGGFIAEGLARTGFEDILVMDFDTIEMHNLDRLCYATQENLGDFKVDVLKRRLEAMGTANPIRVEGLLGAVYEDELARAALDCDMLFACVDRPWGRYALNIIAYAHLIPVFDGGIAVRTNRRRKLVSADLRAHTATPGRACLQCLGQYDPGLVQTEREGLLDDTHYIDALPQTHPLKMRENVAIFSMSCASLQALQMLSFAVAPLGQSNPGAQRYSFVSSTMAEPLYPECDSACNFPKLIAKGDHAGIPFTGPRPQKSGKRLWARRYGNANT